ncbi:MAG: M24 family metallopeptidase [Vicinamibacterales bacterium]
MPAPAARLEARLRAVRQAMRSHDLDGLLVTHLPNIFYLTNFAGSAAMLLVTDEAVHVVTDFRYTTSLEALLRSEHACPGAVLVPFDQTYDETMGRLLRKLSLSRVGFEAAWMPVSRFLWLAGVLGIDPPRLDCAAPAVPGGARLVPTERLIESARARKDDYELGVFRRAGRLVSELTEPIIEEVEAGITEREVAARVDLILREGGFQRTSFETIVASGPNAALPHARPSERRLSEGDLVVLDFGGVLDGYCVDITRTVSIGEPGEEAARVHEAVLRAQEAAIRAVRAGVAADAPDRAAREVLSGYGLEELFGHGTGHGLGVEVHEEPRIGPARQAPVCQPATLEAGMVVTMEPGAYRPGWGGARIEDDVVVTGDGCETLTWADRSLRAR